jgi:hypothetical protein
VGGEDRTSGAAGTEDDADADADADEGVDTNAGAARPEGTGLRSAPPPHPPTRPTSMIDQRRAGRSLSRHTELPLQ